MQQCSGGGDFKNSSAARPSAFLLPFVVAEQSGSVALPSSSALPLARTPVFVMYTVLRPTSVVANRFPFAIHPPKRGRSGEVGVAGKDLLCQGKEISM